MRRLFSIRHALIAATLFAAGFAATSTQACDGPGGYREPATYRAVAVHGTPTSYPPRYEEPVDYTYEKVTVYEYEKVPAKQPVIAYDAWGEPVVAYKTVYRTVKVPVTKLVKVWH